MPKYIIEREVPNAGAWTPGEFQGAAQTSCDVLRRMGPEIQWVHSYVAGDRIYCIYIAPNEALIREHATQSGFPADRITEVAAVMDPTTAEDRSTAIG